MPHSREEKVALLRGCAELPQLTDFERGILIEMAEHTAADILADWGRENFRLHAYVAGLFVKLRKIVDVPQPQV